MIDDDDVVAQALGFFHVMRGVDHAFAARFQCFQIIENRIAALRIDADRRFVEQQNVRVMHQRTGDIEPALHAAGKGRGFVVGAIGEADQFKASARTRLQQFSGNAVQRAEQFQVADRRQVFVQRQILRDETDFLFHRARVIGDALTRECHLARVGCREAADHRNRRGFPRAIRA